MRIAAAFATVLIFSRPADALACPFCKALEPTLCQLREESAIVALAEAGNQRAARRSFELHQVLVGAQRLGKAPTLELTLDAAVRPGGLVVIFGTGSPDQAPEKLSWHAVGVNETSYAYFARAPSLKVPAAERLAYFAPFLEHADPLVARDAYYEFGHATFDDVSRAAGSLPFERMRSWLKDPAVPPERKGFYGVALSLVEGDVQRRASARLLRRMIETPEDDFRAGFDGILGGYLLLAGVEGLELIETRYLANPRSADGDVRHSLTALRFAHEYAREIPIQRLQAALRHLLDRPAFAAAAITDLARWCDWSVVDAVSERYGRRDFAEPSIRQAIVGYLLACPESAAAKALSRLRAMDPQGVAAAEQVVSRTSGVAPATE